jgi:hypothetical protein
MVTTYESIKAHSGFRSPILFGQRAAALMSSAWAMANSRWLGQPEAIANVMRRTLVRTSAPILRSLRRIGVSAGLVCRPHLDSDVRANQLRLWFASMA